LQKRGRREQATDKFVREPFVGSASPAFSTGLTKPSHSGHCRRGAIASDLPPRMEDGMQNAPGPVVDLANAFIALHSSGAMDARPNGWPPPRLDGYTIGIWETDRPAPHNGEMHPDGDELLVVLSGEIVVELEDGAAVKQTTVPAGHALIVPRGLWHRVIPQGRCRLLYATPGPNVEVRLHVG
jgi:mannose-6-phosphate isomerase-like protein (cupin superfamily)